MPDIRKHWTAVSTLLGLISSVYLDHGIHCWWDPIRSKQLSSISVCRAQEFARFFGHSNVRLIGILLVLRRPNHSSFIFAHLIIFSFICKIYFNKVTGWIFLYLLLHEDSMRHTMSIHCWWYPIRSKQLSSISVCRASFQTTNYIQCITKVNTTLTFLQIFKYISSWDNTDKMTRWHNEK